VVASGDSVSLANGCVNSANGWVPVPVWAWERGRVDFSLERPETNSRDVLLGGETVQTRVQKWGNSLALRIPKPFALQLRLAEGQPVELGLDEGRMTVEPSQSRVPSLDELVARIRTDRTPRSWQ